MNLFFIPILPLVFLLLILLFLLLRLLSFSHLPSPPPRLSAPLLSWEPIVNYVNEQYEKYLREELHVNRKRRIPDSRVHCCVYFLPATGHRCVSLPPTSLNSTLPFTHLLCDMVHTLHCLELCWNDYIEVFS